MKRFVTIAFLAALGCGGDETKPTSEPPPPPNPIFDKSKAPAPPPGRKQEKGTAG
jgi:hypothetical protein